MKKFSLMLGLLTMGLFGWANAQVNVGVNINSNGRDAFHLAIGDYFKVSPQQIQSCQESNIPNEDQPVVFFFAQRANVSPESVILLRNHGMSWMQIARRLRINPSVFYTPGDYAGTPYEDGSRRLRDPRKRVVLSDSDIVNFVNLKFASEHYGHEPREVVQMRTSGHSFTDIHRTYSNKRERVQWDEKDQPRPEKHHHDEGRP